MKNLLSHLFLLLSIVTVANAQSDVSGLVQDRASRKAINFVDVFNLNNKAQTATNAKGEFKINAKVNDLLVFWIPGYRKDTLLLTSLGPVRRYLEKDVNLLNSVTVKGTTNIKEQYAETFNKANAVLLTPGRGLLFYPSTFFSREGKQARRFKRMLKAEVKEAQIDARFNAKTVTPLLPLKQPELDAFLVLYRPTLKFVQSASADDFKFYLIKAYDEFKLLPPEKKVLPRLKLEENN
ncbi:MAG: hypothetical protein EOO42_03475 [Flavobacteriales bacterium]|nr:MAG: hypothetical protein EOO42_03475 [Flavobacteriales bacterium]